MQALVLVSVFRQQTRDKLVEYIEWCLPDRIPWLWDRMGYRHTPAQMVHNAIVSKIGAFQAGVARRQSASHQDPRQALRRCDGSCGRRLVRMIRIPQARLVGRIHVVLVALPARRLGEKATVLSPGMLMRRWLLERMADNFRSIGAFKAWVWGYVPIVGGASAWSSIVFLMVMHFVASCVEQFAQSQASYEHNRELLAQALRLQKLHASR